MGKLAIVASPADSPAPALSPSRAALAGHLAKVAAAQAEVERLGRPVARLKAEHQLASIALQNIRNELGAIEGAETADLRTWASRTDGAPRPGRREAQREPINRRVGDASDVLSRIDAALAETAVDFDEARRRLAELASATPPLMLMVLGEIGAELLPRLQAVRAAAVAVEAEAAGLASFVFRRGREMSGLSAGDFGPGSDALAAAGAERARPWFEAGERFLAAIHAVPEAIVSPAEGQASEGRWSAFARRLATDAAAEPE